jgi:signal transduction histidine kinase
LAICVVAVVLAADLLWGRWTEATVADFVTQLGARPDVSTLEGALQHALGDRSVAIGYWVPDEHRYVNDRGHPFPLPTGDPSRIVVHITEQDEPVAALVHDAALGQDKRLMAEVTGALRLALGNARLRAQVRSNVSQLSIARRRLVEGADTQRRHLESELDGGPQHELSEMSRLLERLNAHGDAPGRDRLAPMRTELAAAQQELRDLAHGIRPPALESGGLAAALPQLIGKAPAPVGLTVAPDRLSPTVEGALYFVCAEALTNIAKHAHATRASVTVQVDREAVVAQIVDDGCGGVNQLGSGLRGLTDRVEALGGKLTIRDKAPRGTEVVARIPREEAR